MRLRGLPESVQLALQALPAASHPMDVLRTGTSVLGCTLAGEGRSQHRGSARHRRPAARQPGLDALLLVPLQPLGPDHRGRNRRRLDRRSLPAPAARRAGTGLVGQGDARVAQPVRRARVQRVDVHRPRDRGHGLRPLFVHHRRDRCAARPEARRRQRSRLRSAEALRDARRSRSGHQGARRAQGSHHRLRPPGLHDQRSAQQGDQGSRAQPVARSRRPEDVPHRRAPRNRHVGHQEDVPEPRLVQRGLVSHDGCADRHVHAAVRDRPHRRLERARDRAAHRRQDHPAERELHGTGRSQVRSSRAEGLRRLA